MTRAEHVGRTLGRVALRTEQVDGHAVARERRAEWIDRIDAGHTFANLRAL